ncbi:MAG: hypothetical protein ABI678_17275 [Kofleriaceae bacterium]
MRLSVFALVVVAACKPAKTPDDYFGTEVVPPRGLDKIVPGMTEKEALAAQPAARLVRRAVIAIPSGVKDVELLAITDDKPAPVIVRVVARVTQPFSLRVRGDIAQRWGKEIAHDTWTGTSWRALLQDDGAATELEFWPAMTPAFWAAPGAPPVALAKVKPGMTKHQLEELVPITVTRSGRFVEDKTTVHFDGEDKPGGLAEITMFLGADHARATLLKAWGPGAVDAEEAGMRKDFVARHLWFDPATGWRAILHEAKVDGVSLTERHHDDMLIFQPYVTIATLLGDGPELAVLASSPFGKTIEELATSYPGMPSNVLTLPPTELSRRTTAVFVLDDKAKVDTVRVVMDYAVEGQAALKTAFDRKWGAPKPGKDGLLVYHAGAPYVSAHDDGHSWELVVRPVAPVASATVR